MVRFFKEQGVQGAGDSYVRYVKSISPEFHGFAFEGFMV